MKKLMRTVTALALTACLGTAGFTVSASAHGCGHGYAARSWGCAYYVDGNGDGICDNCQGQGTCHGRTYNNRGYGGYGYNYRQGCGHGYGYWCR